MEKGAIKVPNEIVRSETFPRTRHRQRASSTQDIDQRGSSSVPSFPGHLDLPTTPPYQQPDVSNFESNGFTNQRQEKNAGDASTKALWPLFVKIEPALSSLLRDLADWNAKRQSQEESVQTDVEDASSTEDVESNETSEREKRFQYLNIYLPLFRAGLKGDWQAIKAILKKYPDAVRVPLTDNNQNILHVAAAARRDTFVEVLTWMTPDDLELKDAFGNTAFSTVAESGVVKIAEEMLKINDKLLLIRDVNGNLPLLLASLLEHRDMVSYLFSVTPFEELTATDRIDLLFQTISADLYDIALKILKRDPTLATAEDSEGRIALEMLAKKPFAVGSRSQMSTWKRCLNSC